MDPETFYSNSKMCRVCPRTEDLTNLYLPTNKTVLKNLNLIVYIENEDISLLPKFICQICKDFLTNFIEFKTQCEERDKEMRENIRTKLAMKAETSDVEEDNENLVVHEIESFIIEKVESMSDEEPTMNYEDEEEDDNTDSSSNQLRDFEPEIIYNDVKQIPESIPLKKKPAQRRKCSQCDIMFDTVRKYREHVSSQHPETHKNSCIVCSKQFSSITLLNQHKIDDHKQCTKCPKAFSSYRLMRDHFRRVHINKPKERGNFPCKLCGRVFKLKSSIGKHIRSYHNNERLHHCESCGKGFFELGQLKAHILIHTDERPVICDFADCGKAFKSVEHLKTHKICHLPPEERKVKDKSEEVYICSYCGKALQTKMGHDLHLRIHTNEKPHECDICHTKFRYPHSMIAHRLIHTNEKPYPCDLCSLAFRQKIHLKTHQLVHQTEKKFSCQICGMSTKFKNNLNAHMKNVHRAERNYLCEHCDESYYSKSMLKKHMLVKHKDVELNVN